MGSDQGFASIEMREGPSASDASSREHEPQAGDLPTDAQWTEVKELALKFVSDGLRSPEGHLGEVRRHIASALNRDVE